MPLARLSIKAALRVAANAVIIQRHINGTTWIVTTHYNDHKTESRGEWTRAEAKIRRRHRRIFVALVALGMDETLAMKVSVSSSDTGDWRTVVRQNLERYLLTKA